MAIQLNIPSKSVYGLREANAHVYHLVIIIYIVINDVIKVDMCVAKLATKTTVKHTF